MESSTAVRGKYNHTLKCQSHRKITHDDDVLYDPIYVKVKTKHVSYDVVSQASEYSQWDGVKGTRWYPGVLRCSVP